MKRKKSILVELIAGYSENGIITAETVGPFTYNLDEIKLGSLLYAILLVHYLKQMDRNKKCKTFNFSFRKAYVLKSSNDTVIRKFNEKDITRMIDKFLEDFLKKLKKKELAIRLCDMSFKNLKLGDRVMLSSGTIKYISELYPTIQSIVIADKDGRSEILLDYLKNRNKKTLAVIYIGP